MTHVVSNYFRASITLLLISLLSACASSKISRGAENSAYGVYEKSHSLITSTASSNPVSTFESSSATAQGALIGGAAGAIAGGSFGGGGALPGGVGGAILGGMFGGVMGKYANQMDKVENLGGNVFVLGDQIKVILPSNKLFAESSDSFSSQGYAILNATADLINHSDPMSVKVAAFGEGSGVGHVDQSLSEAQANQIVKYLWKKTNSRLLSAMGLGNSHLIAPSGSAANYRVEITMEKYAL